MKILLIEDDERILDFLTPGLEEEGHEVRVARDGAEGLHFASAGDFDVAILDLMLPILDGYGVCETLRKNEVDIKILMLSALETTDDIVRGLRMGADEYMTKPFAFAELLARLDLLHSRAGPRRSGNRLLNVCDLKLDRDNRKVTKSGQLIELAAFEFKMLEYLMLEVDNIVSRDQIIQNVWGTTQDPKTNVVDVYIRKLRRKLGPTNENILISTVRGLGYRLNSC